MIIRPLACLAVLVLSLAVCANTRAAVTKKPNVLFIAVDDLRDWVGFLGAKERTQDGKAKKQSKIDTDGGVGGIKFAPLDCEDDALPNYHITNYGIEQLGKKHSAKSTTSRSSSPWDCTSRTCPGTSRRNIVTCSRRTKLCCRRISKTTSATSRQPA